MDTEKDVSALISAPHSRRDSVIKLDDQSNIELSEFLRLENDCALSSKNMFSNFPNKCL